MQYIYHKLYIISVYLGKIFKVEPSCITNILDKETEVNPKCPLACLPSHCTPKDKLDYCF